jgi:hypothetical protein
VPDGEGATPAIGAISLTSWLILGGLGVLYVLGLWLERRAKTAEPLFDPDLLGVPQLHNGLTILGLQYMVTTGLFFTVPLFLSIVLGLSAYDTGIRTLPLSVALVLVAPAIPKFFPEASPRRVVRIGFGLLVVALALFAARKTRPCRMPSSRPPAA